MQLKLINKGEHIEYNEIKEEITEDNRGEKRNEEEDRSETRRRSKIDGRSR